ncbi:MAG: DUF1800 domain-containing protein [Blastocatellia bacterium]
MKLPIFSHRRVCFLLAPALVLAAVAALPFAAQQPSRISFDESRLAADLTNALQLQPEQADRLRELLDARRPRIESIQRQISDLQPGSPEFTQLRAQMERERRAVLEDLLPSLRPDQQVRLRGFMGAPPTQPQPGNPPSPVAPLKPALPNEPFAAGERLIAVPNVNLSRSRRASDALPSLPALNDEQRILHLLNRAGFGPRPGDIERVRQMGIERYLEQQLHPEEMSDDFLTRPLGSLRTLQMTTPEIAQNYAPPPVPPRPQPTPTPTPKPLQAGTPALTGQPPAESVEPGKPRMTNPGSPASMDAPQSMQSTTQGSQESQEPKPQRAPAPRPAPPPRDGQLPLRELQQAKLLRAVFSEKQLQEVMVDFWYNHFNVWANKDAARWMVTSYERDVIRPHAMGKFKELLLATAQSPAMLYYLDNFLSQVELPLPPPKYDADGNPIPPPRRPGLNENYARELMELHTLGVDGGYTQKDVTEVARCFTGWTVVPQPNTSFIFRPRTHDRGEKVVLGTRIPAGGGIEDGLRVLDLLSKHPATAKFIAQKLCQRFVADDPLEPPARTLVDRAAEVFRKTDGDIREVVREILTSPEFYSPKHYRAKIKSPLDLAASAIRATGAATDGASPLIQAVGRMGAPIYGCQPPTGYDEKSAEWLSSATLLERMNFAVALLGNRIAGTRVDVARFVAPNAGNDPRRLLDQLVAALVHSDVSPETRENLMRVLNDSRAQAVPAKFDAKTMQKNNEQMVGGIAALVLGSREFQVK